jgi:hypothetical protein
MPQDPSAIFGGLMRACIRDEYTREDKRVLAEGAVFLILGVCASFATTLLLSWAGYFV